MGDAAELDEAAIRARLEAATEGPWTAEAGGSEGHYIFGPEGSRAPMRGRARVASCTWLDWYETEADAEFIAHARTDIPLLLAALDEARTQVERLHFDLDREARARQEAEGAIERVRAEVEVFTERANAFDGTPIGDSYAAAARRIAAAIKERPHGPDWSGSMPGEPPSCQCGYNGTPEDCEASRAALDPAVPATEGGA